MDSNADFKAQIEEKLTTSLSPSTLDVVDTSGGCGSSFTVTVVSEKFVSLRALKRHQLVYGALGDTMEKIHAIEIKAYTPEEQS